MDSKIDQNFACILSGLLVALGPNMAPKVHQKGAEGVVHFPPVFVLGGVPGGSGGLLGSKSLSGSDFHRFVIDFCMIFGTFCRFSGRFVDFGRDNGALR